MTTKVCLD